MEKILQMQKKFEWSKIAAIGAGLALVSSIVTPCMVFEKPQAVDQVALTLAVKEAVDSGLNSTDIVAQLTSLDLKVSELNDDYFQADAWESQAETLASEEWEDNDYKDIYNALDDLFADIDEREDIDKVVLKDTSYSSMDSDDKNGVVTQELKVYYEDKNGDDKKVYLTVTSTLEDDEVVDQDITETL